MIGKRHHVDHVVAQEVEEKDDPRDDLQWVKRLFKAIIPHIRSFLNDDFDLFLGFDLFLFRF